MKPIGAGELEIDMYHGDGEPDFKMMKATPTALGPIDRIYMKVSQSSPDPAFVRRAHAAQEAGFDKVGGYHFMTDEPGAVQAKRFIGIIKDAGFTMTLAPCLDVEDGYGLDARQIQTIMADFCDAVDAEFNCITEIYTGSWFILPYKIDDGWGKRPLWLAAYEDISKVQIPTPWTLQTLAGWQFTDGLVVAGMPPNRHLDASWTYQPQV